jgi:hypothetical protein
MCHEYGTHEKSSIDASVGSFQEVFYDEGLSLQRLWSRVCRSSLRAATPHSLRLSQGERAKRPRPIHTNRPLLQEVPSCANAHDCKQQLAALRPLAAYFEQTFHQDVRAQNFALPSVTGSFWALSVGAAGEQPTTYGAEKLPVSLPCAPATAPRSKTRLSPRGVCAGGLRAEGESLLVRNRITDHE